jgi:arginyl-tRNA synthetase
MIDFNRPIDEALSDLFRSHGEQMGIRAEHAQVQYSNKGAQFQCNGALASAKALKRSPRSIAEEWIASVKEAEPELFSTLEIAGPGFINISLTYDVLAQKMRVMSADERLGVPQTEDPQRVFIDFGGYNVAKQLHIGHLRSTIIGETLQRVLRFVGDDVVSDVHLGDWGTQMGMLIEAVRELDPALPYFHEDPEATPEGGYPAESPITLEDMNRLYPLASARSKSDPEVRANASKATALLQSGHQGYRSLWRHFVDLSIAEIKQDIEPFDVHFDLWQGESDAQSRIPVLIEALKDAGHAEMSDGALIVPLIDKKGQEMVPLMLRKRDGGATYHTSDLATIAERVDDGAQRILYVVDARQEMHFKQVFQAAKTTGVVGADMDLEHVKFGTINGEDGRPFKTRSGDTIKLRDVVQMAIEAAQVRAQDEDESQESEEQGEAQGEQDILTQEQHEISQAVAVAAIKFGDLNNHRTSDYILKLEDFCAFEGKTGPYLLYASVRIRSILKKAQARGITPSEIRVVCPEDGALALELTRLPLVIKSVHEKSTPHLLCEYLFNLSQSFSVFYQRCNIVRQPDPAIQGGWLSLVSLCLDTLLLGFKLLGLKPPERM